MQHSFDIELVYLPAEPLVFHSSDARSEIKLIYLEFVPAENGHAGNIAISYHTTSGLGVERLGFELYSYDPTHCGMFANIGEDDEGHDHLKFHANNRKSLTLRHGQGDSFDWEHCHQVHRRSGIRENMAKIANALREKRVEASGYGVLLASSDAARLIAEFQVYAGKYPVIIG